jgi:hypothetical protein
LFRRRAEIIAEKLFLRRSLLSARSAGDCQTEHIRALASGWISSVLALEIAKSGTPTSA